MLRYAAAATMANAITEPDHERDVGEGEDHDDRRDHADGR